MIIIASTTKHILDSYKLIFDKSFLGKFALVFFSQSSVNIEYIGWGYTVLFLQKIFGFEKPINQLWVDFQKNSKKARFG